jgi:hypothetical protein
MATGNRLVRRDCFVFRPGIKIGVRGERLWCRQPYSTVIRDLSPSVTGNGEPYD